MLSSCRVLVVEDEPLVAEHLQDLLTDAEAIVIGPISTMAAARQLVRNGTVIDVALLDLNLGDGSVTPLLEALAARSVPTLVYTGGVVPEAVRHRHPDLVVLTKPVAPARLTAELRRVTRSGAARPIWAPA